MLQVNDRWMEFFYIDRITATRRFVLEHNIKCDKDGYHRVQGSFTGSFQIEPITDKVHEDEYRRKVLLDLKQTSFNDFTTNKLKTIYKNLKRMEKINNGN